MLTRLSPGASAGRSARGLSRASLSPSDDRKRDQENYESDDADHVRHHGNETSDVAGVCPYETDNRSHDEHDNGRA